MELKNNAFYKNKKLNKKRRNNKLIKNWFKQRQMKLNDCYFCVIIPYRS